MSFDELHSEISVCIDCMLMSANGEISPDRDPSEPQPWALWGFGYFETMGGTHGDDCDRDDNSDCDCDNLGFSWSSCDGCGGSLGGDRFRFTMWRHTVASAHESARGAIALARDARNAGFRLTAQEHMMQAAMWRKYLVDIAASDRRFAAWVVRNGVSA